MKKRPWREEREEGMKDRQQKGCGEHAAFGMHEYSEVEGPKCGVTFCWNCCGGTNVHYGGNEKDYMLCPKCGHDVYSE